MAYVGRGVDKISNIEVLDAITFTDSAGPYNITQSSTAFVPTSPNALVISIDGVIQSPSSYTLSVATITFDSSMASTSTMDFMYQIGTGVMTAPSDGSVNAAKLATDAVETVKIKDLNVTNAKIAAGTIDVTAKITGVVPTANLGSGTASSSTYLAGDQTYKEVVAIDIAWQSVVTAATLTAVAGRGYPINTSSNACTVTLPASASVGDQIIFTDYARYWNTNAVTINQNSLNYQGYTSPNPIYDTQGESLHIVYMDATKGWIPINDGAVADEVPQTVSIEFLVVGGGGGGGAGSYTGGGGAGGYVTSTQTVTKGSGAITIAVGDGGDATAGSDSSISGAGITNKTADGGGVGGISSTGGDGGSGGGGKSGAGGTATAGQGYDGGSGTGSANYGNGGGGGASEVGVDATGSTGGNGGDGLSNDITGTPVTYAGGGGGGIWTSGTAGTGGAGGGGAAGAGGGSNPGTDGTDGLGGGGGGTSDGGTGGPDPDAGDGGSGIVILRMLTADYSGTVSGNETPITDGDYTVIKYINTAGGSYTP